MLPDVIDLYNVVFPNFTLETAGPFVDLRKLQIRIYNAERVGAERGRLAKLVRRLSWHQVRDNRTDVSIETAALAEGRVCDSRIVSRSALEYR